jgi:hypothetical protein
MLTGYHRSTRFQKLDGSSPKYLAMHEFETTTLPPEIRIVMGTEWAKNITRGAKAFSTDRWEYISEFGSSTVGEKF